MRYLIDTNIFLEILLAQEKKEECKYFLLNHVGKLAISDFSLHSIGVILFRYKKSDIYIKFINDIFPNIELITLPRNNYSEIDYFSKEFQLDFDDSYQAAITRRFKLSIVTMDRDFLKVEDIVSLIML